MRLLINRDILYRGLIAILIIFYRKIHFFILICISFVYGEIFRLKINSYLYLDIANAIVDILVKLN